MSKQLQEIEVSEDDLSIEEREVEVLHKSSTSKGGSGRRLSKTGDNVKKSTTSGTSTPVTSIVTRSQAKYFIN